MKRHLEVLGAGTVASDRGICSGPAAPRGPVDVPARARPDCDLGQARRDAEGRLGTPSRSSGNGPGSPLAIRPRESRGRRRQPTVGLIPTLRDGNRGPDPQPTLSARSLLYLCIAVDKSTRRYYFYCQRWLVLYCLYPFLYRVRGRRGGSSQSQGGEASARPSGDAGGAPNCELGPQDACQSGDPAVSSQQRGVNLVASSIAAPLVAAASGSLCGRTQRALVVGPRDGVGARARGRWMVVGTQTPQTLV